MSRRHMPLGQIVEHYPSQLWSTPIAPANPQVRGTRQHPVSRLALSGSAAIVRDHLADIPLAFAAIGGARTSRVARTRRCHGSVAFEYPHLRDCLWGGDVSAQRNQVVEVAYERGVLPAREFLRHGLVNCHDRHGGQFLVVMLVQAPFVEIEGLRWFPCAAVGEVESRGAGDAERCLGDERVMTAAFCDGELEAAPLRAIEGFDGELLRALWSVEVQIEGESTRADKMELPRRCAAFEDKVAGIEYASRREEPLGVVQHGI